MTTTTTLRDYQWDAVQRLAGLAKDGQRSLSLVTPTGAGKTVILQALIEKLRPMFPAGLVVAPTVAIETGFRDRRVIAYSKSRVAGHTSAFTALVGDLPKVPTAEGELKPNVKPGVFWHRDTAEGELDQKLSYVLQPDTPPGATFVLTTHIQLALWGIKKLPSDLTNKLLVIDEAHHAGSGDGVDDAYNKLGAFASEWYKRGGAVVYTSATPFRSDGKDVLPEGTLGFTWTLANHAASGCAPAHLKPETIVVPGCSATSQSDFSGESQIEHADDIACEAMVARWVADGKPKAVFIVPPGKGGQAGEWAENLETRLTDSSLEGGPVRVVNAVGADEETKKVFEDALEIERAAKTYEASQVDVFLACKRFDEGTDWSFCSHVYNWGVPSSFGLILQRWGRAFRLKCADYPEKHKDTATISFFVPSISKELLDDYEKTHHDHSLLLACYMADWKTGTEYRNALQIKFATARREQRGEPQNETEELERIEYEQALVVPDVVRVQASTDICKLEGAREEAGLPPPTHAEVVKHFKQQGASEETIHAVGVMLAEKLPHEEQTAVADKVARKMLAGWSAQNPVRPELRAVFKEVVADYEDRTHGVLGKVCRFYTELTGVDSQNVAARLKDMLVKPDLTEEMILEAVKVHLARTGELPSKTDGDATVDFGFPETWLSVETALYTGCRGLIGDSSLHRLLVEHGLKNEKLDLSESMIIDAARRFLTRTGKPPSADRRDDATVDFGFPETWASVDAALSCGFRGLPGGSSLYKLLLMHGLKGGSDLTEGQIIEAVRRFQAQTAKLPTQKSGDATAYFGFPEKWLNVNAALQNGGRGLAGGSSISQLMVKYGLKVEKTMLSEELIVEAARRCQNRTGKLPSGEGGDASTDFGYPEKWHNVDAALFKGGRGLAGKSSLNILLAKFGLREQRPELSEEMIITAAKNYLNRTKVLPTYKIRDATADFGYPESWSAVNDALGRGHRGLPSGSSLDLLFTKHGLKDARLELTEQRITVAALAFLERTGKLPVQTSGDATADFGHKETWANVNAALRVGGRGLVGDSSLAQLLVKYGLKDAKPDLTADIIIQAAQRYRTRTGRLPSAESGDASHEFGFPAKWGNVDSALNVGTRGLPGGSSLSKLYKKHGLK